MPAPAAPDPPRTYDPAHYRRNIRVYYLFMGLTGFMILLPIWIIYLLNHRGLSLTEVGVFESFFWLTIIVAEVPTGAIADRFGRKISLALGSCLFAVSMLIFALADSFTILLSSYLLMGVAMTLYSGALEALLYDTLRVLGRTGEFERHSGRANGLFWLMMVVATAVGGPLAYVLGYSLAIGLSAIFMLAAAVTAMLLREPPRRESDFPAEPLPAGPLPAEHWSAPAANASHTHPGGGGWPILSEMANGFRIVWRIRPVRYIVPFAAVLIALFDMPRFLTQPYVAQHGIDPLASIDQGFIWSALLIPAYLGTMLGMLGAGWLLSRVGARRSFPIILVFGAVFLAPLMIWNHLGLLGAIFMVSIAQAALRPIVAGYINRRITSDQRATVLSIFALALAGAMSVVLLGIVPAADAIGFPAAFGLALFVTATLGVALWLLWRRVHQRDQAAQVQRWSMSISKPQAPQIRANGANGDGTRSPSATARPALYQNVQNLD